MMHSCLYLVIILVVCSGIKFTPKEDFLTVQTSPVVIIQSDDYRLPKHVVPVSYKMLLTPDLKDEFTFDGESEIVIKVIDKTNQIVLHANNLTIKSTTLTGPDGESIAAKAAALNTTNNFLVIDVGAELLPATSYTLKFVFEGKLNDNGRGFYRISYEDDHGVSRWSAATFLQPTSARRAFPCWDEPHLKATFDISIRHHKDLHAISNMHIIKTEVDPIDSTRNITTFATTPKMSNYLVALIVTDFESLSNENNSFRIWTKSSDIKRGHFFIRFGEKMLNELETYTGISYASHGLKKIDAVALFQPGSYYKAMENWGCIIFDETVLPITENSHEGQGTKIIMHEFLHQWFGNLVTPTWWQYTWLSEGLATYFTYVFTDKLWPQWRYKDIQVVEVLQWFAFNADCLKTAVSMNHNVNSPTEIQGKFKEITYFKGSSVIRMIAHVLGEAEFQIAVREYLNKMKFNVATSDDLFEEFVKVFPITMGLTVKPIDILNNWANTPGFPVINVTRDYDKNTMNITQKRFLNEPAPGHTETYYVPINYATQGEIDFDNTTVTNWLNKNDPVTEIKGNFKNNEWIIVNKQQFGYYRVNYDERNWNMIADFLQSENYTDIHVINRAQLVNDALELAENKQLRWNVAFNVIKFLKQEVDCIPWFPVFPYFWRLGIRFKNTDFEQSFKNYIAELTENVLRNLTLYESLRDDEITKKNRQLIVGLACYAESQTCRNISTEMINSFMDLFAFESSILCAHIRDANRTTWNKIFKLLVDNRTDYLVYALGCTKNANRLKYNLRRSIHKTGFSTVRQELFRVAIAENTKSADLVLDFINANADRIYKVSGNSTDELKKYIYQLGESIGTERQLNKLKNASNEHVKSVIADGIKAAEKRLAWLNEYRQDFIDFFAKKSPILPK